MPPSLINIHRIDRSNIGDMMSSPQRYFDLPGSERRDIFDRRPIPPGASILLGGGGIFQRVFYKQLDRLARSPGRGRLIVWGAGHNRHGRTFGPVTSIVYHPILASADLVGVRDYGGRYEWVPCASCMHPAFDRRYAQTREAVIFSHARYRIEAGGIDSITNDVMDMDRVIAFLGSARTILTSSYHGMYWGMLLGKRVIAMPMASRFYYFKRQPAYLPDVRWKLRRLPFLIGRKKYECDASAWKELPDPAPPQAGLLEECRRINREFYGKVLESIQGMINMK